MQDDLRRIRDGPEFANGQRLDALIRTDEPEQQLGIESAVGVGHEGPGESVHARIPFERALRQFAQAPIELAR